MISQFLLFPKNCIIIQWTFCRCNCAGKMLRQSAKLKEIAAVITL